MFGNPLATPISTVGLLRAFPSSFWEKLWKQFIFLHVEIECEHIQLKITVIFWVSTWRWNLHKVFQSNTGRPLVYPARLLVFLSTWSVYEPKSLFNLEAIIAKNINSQNIPCKKYHRSYWTAVSGKFVIPAIVMKY